jgi:hypothetical protein
MRKNGLLAVVTVVAAVGIAAAPASAATSSGPSHAGLLRSVLGVAHSRQTAARIGSSLKTISESTTASVTATIGRRGSTLNSAASPLIDPPASCKYETELSIVSAYQDGTLVTSTATWKNSIDCIDGKKNTSMAYLRAASDLYRDTEQVRAGDVRSCVYPNKEGTVCKYVSSVGVNLCTGILCAGVYQAIGYDDLELPVGWVWTSTPDRCVLINNSRELICYEPTATETVTRTD